MPFGVPDFHALHIEQGMEYFYRNDFHTALVEFDQALQLRESRIARIDRAYALLALGRYREGWHDLITRHQFGNEAAFTENGRRLRRKLPQWDGKTDQRVVLLHEAGYGDSIMFLRMAQLLDVSFVFDAPLPLQRLFEPAVPIGNDGDAWFSLFDLPALFDDIPSPPYLAPDPALVAKWRGKIGNGGAKHIGIAWSSNTSHVGEIEARSIQLPRFLDLLPFDGVLHALQNHDLEIATSCGVQTPDLADFADVAALAACMDVIVSIDTAALHVAGAIDHPRIYAMLPYTATWRWHAGNRWYPNMKLCQTQAPNDWASAFMSLKNWK